MNVYEKKQLESLDDYQAAQYYMDAFWEDDSKEDIIHHLVLLCCQYEQNHPDEISQITGDETWLPEEDTPFWEDL